MVLAGITVHYVFAGVGLLPTERPTLGELVRFEIDYAFWLNLVFAIGGGALLYLLHRPLSSGPMN